MEKVFINISNHPSSKWTFEQSYAAKRLADQLIDLPFPEIDPSLSMEGVERLTKEFFKTYLKNFPQDKEVIVHLMGETSFVISLCAVLGEFRPEWMIAVSTSKREVVEIQELDGSVTKTAVFKFVQFRRIPTTLFLHAFRLSAYEEGF